MWTPRSSTSRPGRAPSLPLCGEGGGGAEDETVLVVSWGRPPPAMHNRTLRTNLGPALLVQGGWLDGVGPAPSPPPQDLLGGGS